MVEVERKRRAQGEHSEEWVKAAVITVKEILAFFLLTLLIFCMVSQTCSFPGFFVDVAWQL